MTSLEKALRDFAQFAARLKGDEKSEAQTFLFHLLAAFGHDPSTLPEGSTFEYRVRFANERTKFADFVWPGRALIEMKSRGVKLSKHYQQSFDYWLNLVPHRPPYVVLCNFDEFWIYDFNTQLNEPVDCIPVADLPARHAALNFLFPRAFQPLFGHNWVEVTREAARDVAQAFNSLVARGEDRVRARRFVLQCVVAMFAEDIGLLPRDIFTRLLDECRRGASSYDLIGGLFRQMNDPNPARAGRYAGVDYFNGGLFATVDPIELTPPEAGPLFAAANENNWGYVQPIIFGTLFEGSLGKEERHALGAHFTYESDIQKIVRPTIVRPWDERIAAARTAAELLALLTELHRYRVLDPACGCGNFLFVAYRVLREIEQRLLLRLFALDKRQFAKVGLASGISLKNFFGLDVNENAVETAKVTLMLARRLAHRDAEKFWEDHADELPGQETHPLEFERDLPLDNLDANIVCADALFTPWPEVEAIIGNPPFLDARRVTMIHGAEYSDRLRAAFPDVPGRADFCVHWFRKAHEVLKPGCRAGLVGTNTVRQNYSRQGGLDYITANNGLIIEAVSTQVWSGESAVHVSIVNWVKLPEIPPEQATVGFWLPERKRLFTQLGDAKNGEWRCEELETIGPALSADTNVTAAVPLKANQQPKPCFEGQQPGHDGFRLGPQARQQMVLKDKNTAEITFPYLNGDELLSGAALRFIIDFGNRAMDQAARYGLAFNHLKREILPKWQANANAEREKSGKESGEHQNRLQTWWLLKRRREQLLAAIQHLPRYIVCASVTKRPIFEFLSSSIRPDSSLTVFAFADDYSFGILQSGLHWAWFKARCSTLKGDFRYTSDTVFDTFPWPQSPTHAQVKAVAEAARALRALRREIMQANGWSLRDLYRTLETPGTNRLRDAQAALDSAVRAAYGMKEKEYPLAFLLRLNLELADKEAQGEKITPPGLPSFTTGGEGLTSQDCIQPLK